MGTLKEFFGSKSIQTKSVVIASRRVENGGNEARAVLNGRAKKRRTKNEKSYAELGLAKPKTGRGVSAGAVESALADKPVSRKARTKIFRAVNAILATKKQPAVEWAALWANSTARAGKKPVDKKAAAKK